mgnify:CR=1 FL=1
MHSSQRKVVCEDSDLWHVPWGRLTHVLQAMGVPRVQALAAIRLSLGRSTTAADVAAVVAGLPPLLLPMLATA